MKLIYILMLIASLGLFGVGCDPETGETPEENQPAPGQGGEQTQDVVPNSYTVYSNLIAGFPVRVESTGKATEIESVTGNRCTSILEKYWDEGLKISVVNKSAQETAQSKVNEAQESLNTANAGTDEAAKTAAQAELAKAQAELAAAVTVLCEVGSDKTCEKKNVRVNRTDGSLVFESSEVTGCTSVHGEEKADSGAADSGAADSGAADSGAADSGAADSGAGS